MPTVTAKVDGNSVRSSLLTNNGGRNDAWFDRFTSLADRCDVVDIYVEASGHNKILPQR